MAALKKPIKAKAMGVSVAKKPMASKAAPVAVKRVVGHRFVRGVAFATVGGFKVFGSPVQPAHWTSLQIEEAVAELN
jgi:hypothetical protein